jgi:type VI secretion system secreted protein Hcp
MAIYLKVADIEGDVTAKEHEGKIECSSMQWGVGRGITTSTGSSQERESSAPSVSEVTITKAMDKCTPQLFKEACVGKSKEVTIDLIQTGGTQLDTYMSYTLHNSLISGYSVSANSEGRPEESVSFNFTKVEMKYTPYDNEHNPGSPAMSLYDISLGTAE